MWRNRQNYLQIYSYLCILVEQNCHTPNLLLKTNEAFTLLENLPTGDTVATDTDDLNVVFT